MSVISEDENLDSAVSEIDCVDLVICATDDNASEFNLPSLLLSHPKACLFGGTMARTEVGDVFRYRPGGPYYCCLIGNMWFDVAAEEIINKSAARWQNSVRPRPTFGSAMNTSRVRICPAIMRRPIHASSREKMWTGCRLIRKIILNMTLAEKLK